MAHSRSGAYKIGISNNLRRREAEIDESMRGDATPLFFIKMRNAGKVEKRLHEIHRAIHAPLKKGSGRTEWFDPGVSLFWPLFGLVLGLIGFYTLPYGQSGSTLVTCAAIGFTGYGVVFVLANVVYLIAHRLKELAPAIFTIVLIALLLKSFYL